MDRRSFIDFLGKGVIAVPLIQVGLSGCTKKKVNGGIAPSMEDRVNLIEGLDSQVFLKWGDRISDADYFGFNNDYLAFLSDSSSEGLLWVSHESVNTMMVSGYDKNGDKARHVKQINQEMYNVGGSLVRIRRDGELWKVINDAANFRITASQNIPFEWHEGLLGRKEALGTVANSSGGVTPWGTILSCEKNYSMFYGELDSVNNHFISSVLQWESFMGKPPQHYGWVVEVDPQTGDAKKHVAMGRFAHACATVVPLRDGRVVVYSGDDQDGGCLYKYISDEPGKLYPGKLYVANMDNLSWELIDYQRDELKGKFLSDTEMMIQCREAASIVGGSSLDRPADIAVDPISGNVIIALINNRSTGNDFGSILRIKETGNDYESLTFEQENFLTGGEETGFACPTDLVFDQVGNFWFTSSIPSSSIGKKPYTAFGNNGLYVVLRNGEKAGKVIQVASAPMDAEFSGLCFTPDGETLFVSVQHPGEQSTAGGFTSNWPHGEDSFPKPSVIALSGSFLEAVQNVV